MHKFDKEKLFVKLYLKKGYSMHNRCLNCGNSFYTKRNLLSLFSNKKMYLCNLCIRQNPINLKFEEIILDKYTVTIITMFNNVYIKDFSCFFNEYGKIYKAIYLKTDKPIIFIEHINLNDDVIEEIDEITKLFSSDIIILSFTKKSY